MHSSPYVQCSIPLDYRYFKYKPRKRYLLFCFNDACGLNGDVIIEMALRKAGMTIRKLAGGVMAVTIAGAMLGGVVSILQSGTHLREDEFDQSVVTPYQNFALYMGIVTGALLGLVGMAVFLRLVKRFQFPASTRLGMWLGAICGVLICLSTGLMLNGFAASFGYLLSRWDVMLVNSLITCAVGGVFGLVSGYFIAEIGERALRYN
jgi:hypothetical protein